MATQNSNDHMAAGPITLAQVLAEELRQLRPDAKIPDNPDLPTIFQLLHREELTALCFSGGGIRSATFGLGIVQSLAKHGLLEKFDYLSTVSGGGYLGSWLSAWILRERVRLGGADASGGLAAYDVSKLAGSDPIESDSDSTVPGVKDMDVDKIDSLDAVREIQKKINCPPLNSTSDPNPEPDQLQHLREYSNYMSPRVGLLSADTWTLIGIYLRNLFLNLTIFIPLIAAVLMLPRLFYSTIYWNTLTSGTAAAVLVASVLLGGAGVAFILYNLPSKIPPGERRSQNTDAWVVGFGVAPLLLMAIALSTVWVSTLTRTDALASYRELLETYTYLPKNLNQSVVYFIVTAYVVGIVGYVFYSLLRRYKNVTLDLRSLFAAVVGAPVWGVVLWIVPARVFDPDRLAAGALNGSEYFLAYVCLSVPLFLLIYLVTGAVYVGLSSGTATDEDREWLARYGAWILIVCVVWVVLNGLVLFGPLALEYIASVDWTLSWQVLQPIIVTLIGVLSGVISLFGGFSSQSLVRHEPVQSKTSRVLAVAPKVAAVIFLGFIFVGLAYGTGLVLRAASSILESNGFPSFLLLPATAHAHRDVLMNSGVVFLLLLLVVIASIGIFMAFFVNVNKFSLHGAYRDRLVRAYLGASNRFRKTNTFTGFDESDNFQLHRLKRQRPFHIINATLNLVGGKQLAWQNRKAASFTMSPLHCGSWTLDYRRTNEYCRNVHFGPCKKISRCNRLEKDCGSVEKCKLPGKSIRLGTAMAISGAAANPNMGYYSSSVVTFLMSLFNIRLGWWLGNTGIVGSRQGQFRPAVLFEAESNRCHPAASERNTRPDRRVQALHKRHRRRSFRESCALRNDPSPLPPHFPERRCSRRDLQVRRDRERDPEMQG